MDYSFSHAVLYLQVQCTPTDVVIAQQQVRKSGPVMFRKTTEQSTETEPNGENYSNALRTSLASQKYTEHYLLGCIK